MPFTIACPNCDARLQAPDTVEGKRVKCKKCGEAFVARPADEEDDRPAGKARRRAEDDEDDRPRRASKAARRVEEDDYDDEDRPRRRRRDDEDDEQSPRSRRKGKKKAAGPPVLLFVLLGVGALVLLGGGVGAYLYFSDEKMPDNPVAKGGPGANAPGGPGPAPAGLTAGWVEHNDAAGRYRVRFPTVPQSQTVTQQTPNGPVNVSLHLSGGPSEVFVSGSQPVPPEHRMGLSDDQVLDLGMEMAKMHGKGAAVRDTQSITYQGFAGRQLLMSAPGKKGSLIMRLILTKDRLIFLMAGGDSASADAPRVKAFFESLKID
jgi:hypothetical protein